MRVTQLLFVTLIPSLAFGQPSDSLSVRLPEAPVLDLSHFEECRTFQYVGVDSTNARLSRSQSYDSEGRVIGVVYDGHKLQRSIGRQDGKSTQLRDGNGRLLEDWWYGSIGGDPGWPEIGVSFHLYGSSDTVRVIHYQYARHKTDAARNDFRRDSFNTDDFDDQPSWEKTGEWYRLYDLMGNLIETGRDGEPSRKYVFDAAGRQIREQRLRAGRLEDDRQCSYDTGGYYCIHRLPQLELDSPDRWSELEVYRTDSEDRIIDERVFRRGALWVRKVYTYDDKGREIRSVVYQGDDIPYLTSITNCVGE